MNSTNLKVDPKGRIMLPKSFRDSLGIKIGENVCLELDRKDARLLLFPIEKTDRKLIILLQDVSGALSKVARILASHSVDIIYSESRSIKRKKEAVWAIVADFQNVDIECLKHDLKAIKEVLKISFERIS